MEGTILSAYLDLTCPLVFLLWKRLHHLAKHLLQHFNKLSAPLNINTLFMVYLSL